MRFLFAILSAVVVAAAATTPAKAAFVYELAIAGDAAAANNPINLSVGDTVAIEVYIRETVTNFLAPGSFGLNSSGVQLNVGLPSVANVPNTSAITGFGASGWTLTPSFSGSNPRIKNSSNPLSPVPVFTSGGRALVGTFVFTALANGSTTVTTGDVIGAGTSTYLDATQTPISLDTELGTTGTDSLTINVTTAAVPEPSSMILLGLGVAGVVGRRLRRKASVSKE